MRHRVYTNDGLVIFNIGRNVSYVKATTKNGRRIASASIIRHPKDEHNESIAARTLLALLLPRLPKELAKNLHEECLYDLVINPGSQRPRIRCAQCCMYVYGTGIGLELCSICFQQLNSQVKDVLMSLNKFKHKHSKLFPELASFEVVNRIEEQ